MSRNVRSLQSLASKHTTPHPAYHAQYPFLNKEEGPTRLAQAIETDNVPRVFQLFREGNQLYVDKLNKKHIIAILRSFIDSHKNDVDVIDLVITYEPKLWYIATSSSASIKFSVAVGVMLIRYHMSRNVFLIIKDNFDETDQVTVLQLALQYLTQPELCNFAEHAILLEKPLVFKYILNLNPIVFVPCVENFMHDLIIDERGNFSEEALLENEWALAYIRDLRSMFDIPQTDFSEKLRRIE